MNDCRIIYVTYTNNFDFTEKNRCVLVYEPLIPQMVNELKSETVKITIKKT